MKQLRTSVNETQYLNFQQRLEELGESEYHFMKEAWKDRMKKTETLPEKANRWLYGVPSKMESSV